MSTIVSFKGCLHHAAAHAKSRKGYDGIVNAEEVPAWIRILQRIVQAIAVAVEVLAVVRHLHIVARTEEAAENGVI